MPLYFIINTMKNYEKTGYLREPFRLFHLKDSVTKEISLHYHDFYKIIVFYTGNVTYMIEGKSYLLKPGDVVLVNKNDIHKPTIDYRVPYERSILYISGECLESCRVEGYDPFFCFSQAAEKKSYVLRVGEFQKTEAGSILAAMETGAQRYGWKAERMLLFQLFLLAVNRICMGEGQKEELRPKAVYHQKIIDVMTYLNKHIFEEVSIDALADVVYMSKYHMMRQFKKETGYTIHKYVTEKRIAAAKEMLSSGMPAARVSEACGFLDYSTFLRAFRSSTQMTPTAFAEARRDRRSDAGHNPP